MNPEREPSVGPDLHKYLHARDSGLAHELIGPPRGRLLDVGSGHGEDLELLEREGWSVVGIDPTMRDRRTRCSLVGVGECLPFRDGSFSAATCILVLPHVLFPAGVVREVYRVLHPGGRAAFVVFSASPLNLRIAVARYGLSEVSGSFAARLFTLRGIRRLLRIGGFPLAHCERSDFLPWTIGGMPPRLQGRVLRALDRLDRRLSAAPFAFLARKIVAVGVKA